MRPPCNLPNKPPRAFAGAACFPCFTVNRQASSAGKAPRTKNAHGTSYFCASFRLTSAAFGITLLRYGTNRQNGGNHMAMQLNKQLPLPADLKAEYPLSGEITGVKARRDAEIRDIFTGRSDKFVVIVGPCSADNEDAVCDYVSRLASLNDRLSDRLMLIPASTRTSPAPPARATRACSTSRAPDQGARPAGGHHRHPADAHPGDHGKRTHLRRRDALPGKPQLPRRPALLRGGRRAFGGKPAAPPGPRAGWTSPWG